LIWATTAAAGLVAALRHFPIDDAPAASPSRRGREPHLLRSLAPDHPATDATARSKIALEIAPTLHRIQ